jgi:predicted Zn-dependent peptidase
MLIPGAGAFAQATDVDIPYQKFVLDNGLTLIVHEDHKAPIVAINTWYHVGSKNEKLGKTGFAHLFEHLMFQGSQNLGKMEFIKLVQSNGGVLNGSTRFDFTNYFETVPANTLQTFLWAEADRMRSLAITQDNLTNQQGVVKSEVRVNVLNRPYGGFPWLDMPQYANTNWYNAHNFYGDLRDIDAATLADAEAFHKTYYSPRNAVVVVTGDFAAAEVMAWIQKYFGNIPDAPLPPRPDLTEPKQEKEIRASKTDSLATRPALAFAYHMPPRNTPEYFAMGLIDQILLQGHDAKLYQALVQRAGVTGDVSGGINLLGNMFDYEGPMLWMVSLFHDAQHSPDEILKLADAVIDSLRTVPVDPATLERARVKERADLYNIIGGQAGFGRADLLASYALFDNNANYVNSLEGQFRAVTPAVILRTAKEYLRPTNRTVLTIVPGKTTNGAVGK